MGRDAGFGVEVMALKNYTTQIEAAQTVGEITGLLASSGITSIKVDYQNGQANAITFAAFLLNMPQEFQLKVNAEAVLTVLKSQKVQPRFQTKEQAFRVGWRILKDVIETQLASVAIKQVELAQAFFGFALDAKTGQTAYEIVAPKMLQLTAGQKG